ncbi:D-alanyl-D-alanine carboxypeptidase [Alginatibacterium sediminis]|uniref:serine-type D-Ala-D-Ala carboxypeptidase n=1 Tax=Alginatibacterium sediminis TaxID=2164068 RepID=A0A420E6G7_9ALTE|nr:serine hydrolase [Alginatibacterium sediminis]RKF12829.1 D-alanyl-D-alanine carboxypeptidase [Alginatibacterium sediminis]
MQIVRNGLIALALTTQIAVAAPQVIPSAPLISAKAYYLIDFDSGEVLAQSNADERLPPASLTKIMTSYIVGKEIVNGNISPKDMVTVSENAWAANFPDSSKMFIEVGKQVSVEDLNRGIIVQSGNDACVAMAEHIAGSEDSFATLMNSWAEHLGLQDTRFENSHGLHTDTHYTTAKDMAHLAIALIRDVPDEYAIYAEKEFTYNNITQSNRNTLLWDRSLNVDGMKTGHTSQAGYSLVSSATDNGMRLVSVVLGTASSKARSAESKKLLNWGFRFHETVKPYAAGDTLSQQRVWMGEQDQVALGVANDIAMTLPRGQAKDLTANFELSQQLKAPLSAGQVVGKVYFQLEDKDVAEYPLVVLEPVPEGSIFKQILDYIKLFFSQWF